MQEPDDNEWIVIFYPQTGVIRLHPTLEAAKRHMSKSGFISHHYRSPKDFQARYDHFTLEKFWAMIVKDVQWRWRKTAKGPELTEADLTPPDCDTERLSKELWNLMQRVGDRVRHLTSSQTRAKDHYVLNLTRLRSTVADEAEFKKKYPKQCRIIVERLSAYETPYVLESELERMMNNLVATGKLKTKQNSWLIFQYYRPQLINDGLIVRGNEGAEESDDEEEAA